MNYLGLSQTNISLIYTDSSLLSEDEIALSGKSGLQSQTLASFVVPSFINQWTQIALEVNENIVALYFRCMRFATRQVSKILKNYSSVFI